MLKVLRYVHAAEFRVTSVQRIKNGQGMSAMARKLGVSAQTLRNWVKVAWVRQAGRCLCASVRQPCAIGKRGVGSGDPQQTRRRSC
ncbi:MULTISPECIES: transposase [unclassified Burkholderia]|uniref:transposase n=1 Tax=Burkholderia sp. MSMB1552 TaxID=1636424 RepID=UPI000AD5BD32